MGIAMYRTNQQQAEELVRLHHVCIVLSKLSQKVGKNLLFSFQIIVVPKIKTNFMLQCYGMPFKNSV